MLKKSWHILFGNLQHKMGQNFLDIQYQEILDFQKWK